MEFLDGNIGINTKMVERDPNVQEITNIASNGIGTARGLASAISAILTNNLISEEVWVKLKRPVSYERDICDHRTMNRGHGLYYINHPTQRNSYLLMHEGHGQQRVIFDPERKIVIALIRNGLLWDFSVGQETEKIAERILQSLD